MKYDSYSRFLKSQLYKDCIVKEMEGKPLLSNINAKSMKSKMNKANTLGAKAKHANNLSNGSLNYNPNVLAQNKPVSNRATPTNKLNNSLNNVQYESNVYIRNASFNMGPVDPILASNVGTIVSTTPLASSSSPWFSSMNTSVTNANVNQKINTSSLSSLSDSPSPYNHQAAQSLSMMSSDLMNQNINQNDSINKREKKRMTIIPWAKG